MAVNCESQKDIKKLCAHKYNYVNIIAIMYISLSPVDSLLYISFTEANKSKTCNVLTDDACCRRQFAPVCDVTFFPPRAKAGCWIGVGGANSNPL